MNKKINYTNLLFINRSWIERLAAACRTLSPSAALTGHSNNNNHNSLTTSSTVK